MSAGRPKKLRDQVVVITGASSGIGLSTAEMAVEKGARVVLAASSEEDLSALVGRLNRRRTRAAYVAVDMSDPNAAELVAERAEAAFGGFDTWVNNADLSVHGRLMDIPLAEMRRVFETNFWGTVNGCRVAVDRLCRRGGVIVNIGSFASEITLPLQGIYRASKHAVKGFTDALRQEIEADGLPIWVTLVKPAPIRFARAAAVPQPESEEGREPAPIDRLREVAAAILRCAERPARDIVVGGDSRMKAAIAAFAPRLTDLYRQRTAISVQQRAALPAGRDDRPSERLQDERRRGRRPEPAMRSSAYAQAVLSDVGRAVPLVIVGALVAAGVAASRRAIS